MNITTKDNYVEVEKIIKKRVLKDKTYILQLNKEEAEILLDIVGRIGGGFPKKVNTFLYETYTALRHNGITCPVNDRLSRKPHFDFECNPRIKPVDK